MTAYRETERSGRTAHRHAYWLALLGLVACSVPKFDFADPHAGGAGVSASAGAGADSGAGPCDGGDCSMICPVGRGDCNDSTVDGCESALDSEQHCGRCDRTCTNTHGSTVCAAAVDGGAACSPTCAAGFADCDLNPSNGCETDIDSDPAHCGDCAFACPANGGTPLCRAGACGVSSCNSGFGDCANVGSCDQNLNTDPHNCGHCGRVCSSTHGAATCNGGSCQIACQSGYGDCNLSNQDGGVAPDDGCETKLNESDSNGNIANCGACGLVCSRRAFTTVNVAQCELGVCSRDCFAGQADCDDNRNTPGCTGKTCGCETTLASDANNCGACGHVCKGGACGAGVCACPDTKPTSGATKCTLPAAVKCGAYATSCTCSCNGGVFMCTDSSGKGC